MVAQSERGMSESPAITSHGWISFGVVKADWSPSKTKNKELRVGAASGIARNYKDFRFGQGR